MTWNHTLISIVLVLAASPPPHQRAPVHPKPCQIQSMESCRCLHTVGTHEIMKTI